MRTRCVAVAVSALVMLAWPVPAQAEECPIPPGTPAASAESEAEFERATACLINNERARRGLAQLRRARRLNRAADRHARDMVARHYFSHFSPEGDGLLDRVRASHYLRGWPGYTLGEILAWGTGSLASPPSIMRAWLKSPGHEAVIAEPHFRDFGIAVVAGVPSGGDVAGATYAVDFGRRER
jgi:uncharacterized protein YkwD